MEDYTGQQFGNYQLQRLLGEGGFAQVYLGTHVHLQNKQAAIKILHHQVNQEQRSAFQREAQVISGLSHPHIIRLIDFGIQAQAFFLVVDYAPGGTLRQRHPKGSRVDLETVVSYVKQLAQALQYAHDNTPRVIHRDLKPENMLVDQRGEILLSDFGIAMMQQTTQQSSTQNISGTALYMAPEQFKGRSEPASDQYALGIVVYEWLTGAPPFQGQNWFEIAYQHLNELPDAPTTRFPELSPEIDQVMSMALAKEPSQRYPSIQAFSDALEQCLAGNQTTERVRKTPDQQVSQARLSPPQKITSPTPAVLPDASASRPETFPLRSQPRASSSIKWSSPGDPESFSQEPAASPSPLYQPVPSMMTPTPLTRPSQPSQSAHPLALIIICLLILLLGGAGFFLYTQSQHVSGSLAFSPTATPEITATTLPDPTVTPTPTPTFTPTPTPTPTPMPAPIVPSGPPPPQHITVSLTDCDALLARAQQLKSSGQSGTTDELPQLEQRLRTCTLSTGSWSVNMNNHVGVMTITLDYRGAMQATLQLNGEAAKTVTGLWDTNTSQITFRRSSADETEIQDYSGSSSGSPAIGYTLNGTFTDTLNPGSVYNWTGQTNNSPDSGQL